MKIIVQLFALCFLLSVSSQSFAELQSIDDAKLRLIVGQELNLQVTDKTRDSADVIGILACAALCPTLQNLNINVPITLEGGITGALFGIDGDIGSGFIGKALKNVENVFK